MAFLIEENRCTSPTSSAQVSAVIGPTAGMVMSRSTRSTSKESRCSDRTSALSVFPRRTTVSRHSRRQRFQPFIDVLVARQQFTEVPDLVKLLFVVAHTGFHQQNSNLVLHLHGLADQQVPIAQRAAPFANLRRGHVALRQKITAQAVGNLIGIDAIVLFLGRGNGS